MRGRLLALGLAAGLLAATAAPVTAAGDKDSKIPDDMTCPERENAAPGEGWQCVLLLDEDGNPTTAEAIEEAVRAAVAEAEVTPNSFTPGNVSSDWNWNWNEVIYYGISPSPGRIGSIRVTTSINLNGRQAQSTSTIVRFSGPSVSTRADQTCWDDSEPTWMPNDDCGTTKIASAGYTNTKLTNYQAPRLNNDHRYWFAYYFAWKPKGYSNSDYSDGHWRLANQPALSAPISCNADRSASRVCIFG